MADLGAILTAMVTPFDAGGRVDEAAAVRLMHFLRENGSDGLVIAGSTGEAAMLSDDEHIGLIALAVDEMRGTGCTVVGATGSNDTRHAVELTERATAAGVDATLSVTPYYVRPSPRGIVAHYTEVARATDKPILLYNIPSRTGIDMPNDLLAELGQIDGIDGVKQARQTDVELVDGLPLFYAGNDDFLRHVLDIGGAGGICVASHVVGPEMRRMVDEPERRAEIDEGLQHVYRALTVTANPTPVKAALNLLGHEVGGHRLPLVEADESELAVIRTALERQRLLQTA